MSESEEEKIPLERTTRVTDALEGLRSAIKQASETVHDLTESVHDENRAGEIVRELRSRGEQAVETISRQVGRNPLTSLAAAFALGYLVAILTRR